MRRTVLFLAAALLVFFFGPAVAPAFAQEGRAGIDMWKAITGGFSIAIAAFGGALSQGRAISAALDGIARNPQASGRMTVPLILGLAFIESLVIYTLVVVFAKL
ncbi:MAG: ATP synthase F0 subunit C [Deltaproteobacteria bacterium]|nr:ATP synthase F0 subunit C [Deltaproteobacteria bacterium]